MPEQQAFETLLGHTWEERLANVVDMMREMSSHTDPQAMVAAYAQRMNRYFPVDRRVSLSRRGLQEPQFRITRDSRWAEDINPWQEPHRLPLYSGGLLAELIYGGEPQVIDDLDVSPDDPAWDILAGQRSLLAIPMFDKGVSQNMVVMLRQEPEAFDRERFPDNVWLANLFGRATHNLVLSDELQRAYTAVDRELKSVAAIQRALLPKEMPQIDTLGLAASYQTSQRAGGDYYDFFPLAGGKWGILIADVSGHGTPAAVVMAITHTIAHLYPGTSLEPGEMLNFVNRHLTERYTGEIGSFVTALYGVYDPDSRVLNYASAGHNPPRLKRCSSDQIFSLEGARNFPLGILPDVVYGNREEQLQPGDRIVFYTDGLTEAQSPFGDLFGLERLDHLLMESCTAAPDQLIGRILAAIAGFTGDAPATDDRTLIVATVR